MVKDCCDSVSSRCSLLNLCLRNNLISTTDGHEYEHRLKSVLIIRVGNGVSNSRAQHYAYRVFNSTKDEDTRTNLMLKQIRWTHIFKPTLTISFYFVFLFYTTHFSLRVAKLGFISIVIAYDFSMQIFNLSSSILMLSYNRTN